MDETSRRRPLQTSLTGKVVHRRGKPAVIIAADSCRFRRQEDDGAQKKKEEV